MTRAACVKGRGHFCLGRTGGTSHLPGGAGHLGPRLALLRRPGGHARGCSLAPDTQRRRQGAVDQVPQGLGPGNNCQCPGQPRRCTLGDNAPWRPPPAAGAPRRWTGRTALRTGRWVSARGRLPGVYLPAVPSPRAASPARAHKRTRTLQIDAGHELVQAGVGVPTAQRRARVQGGKQAAAHRRGHLVQAQLLGSGPGHGADGGGKRCQPRRAGRRSPGRPAGPLRTRAISHCGWWARTPAELAGSPGHTVAQSSKAHDTRACKQHAARLLRAFAKPDDSLGTLDRRGHDDNSVTSPPSPHAGIEMQSA